MAPVPRPGLGRRCRGGGGGRGPGRSEGVARAEEALLNGVQNRDEAHLRQVQPFAQQVDANDHVVDALAQIAQDLYALQRVDLRVQVVRADSHLL